MENIYLKNAATTWNNAFPIGNGFLGAMIFGRTGRERIQVNEDSLWSNNFIDRINPDASKYLNKIRELLFKGNIFETEQLAKKSMCCPIPHMSGFQPLGDIWIDFSNSTKLTKHIIYDEAGLPKLEDKNNQPDEYYRKLNLETATGSVNYRYGKKQYQREFFISNPQKTGYYHLTAGTNTTLSFDVSISRRDNRSGRGASYCDEIYAEDNQYIWLSKKATNDIGFTMGVKVLAIGGKQYQIGAHIIIENAKEALICFTGRTTFRSKNPKQWCKECLKKIKIQNYEKDKKQHITDYQNYFNRHRLYIKPKRKLDNLTTPVRMQRLKSGHSDIGLINLYYDFGRYLLISSSRPGSLPSNLQGIWNEEYTPMWGSKYTININIEMNYWLTEKIGLPELHMPIFKQLQRMLPHGQEVANKMYHSHGFCCHHNTDIWGDCAPQDDNTTATIWPMGGAWLSLSIYEHYIYTKDLSFLKEYYPILRENVLFFLDYMVKDKDGNWITGPSSSPENIYINDKGEYGSLCMGPTMDMEIVRELFTKFLKLAEIMNENPKLKKDVEEHIDNLPKLKIGKYGQIQEWNYDYKELYPGHRHISQLFALYPAQQIRKDKTPDLAKAAEITLQRRLSNGGGHTGWSKAWIILLYARLWRSDEAYQNLLGLLKNSTLDNLLDNHPPFQIDGNLGGACGILEMIIQDYGDRIYLLPALPTEMNTGHVEGIRTKSGHILDMKWNNGKVKQIKIYGKTGSQLVVVRKNYKPEIIKCSPSEQRIINYIQ